MAEEAKIIAGSAYPLEQEITVTLRGRNLITGLPESVEVSSVELREALAPSINVIVETVRDAVDETPPELIADMMMDGVVLAGGGALLRGLDTRLSEETRMKVRIADDPLTCVARGAEAILEELGALRKVLSSMQRGSTIH